MKASEFKKLIKEAVKEAIREELTEVTAPSPAPLQERAQPVVYQPTGNPVTDALNETRSSMATEEYRNVGGGTLRASLAQNFDRSMFMPKGNYSPSSTDPQAVAQSIAAAPKAGLDLTQLGFVSKAAAIVDGAKQKDKQRFGG
jgi:hypothetical protein